MPAFDWCFKCDERHDLEEPCEEKPMGSRESLDRIPRVIRYLANNWPEEANTGQRFAHRHALTILHNAEREIIEHFYPRPQEFSYRKGW